MTSREDSPYVSDWLRVARQDWHRVHVMLADEDGEGAGLFLQQALGKYLGNSEARWRAPVGRDTRMASIRAWPGRLASGGKEGRGR